MKLKALTEDATEDATTTIINALNQFKQTVQQHGFCPSKSGSIPLDPLPINWSIAFAGGDIRDTAEFDQLRIDPKFKDFIKQQFPVDHAVFGHQHKNVITVNIRFNPFDREFVINLNPEILRTQIQTTIDHEHQHHRRGALPRRPKPTAAQYGRMPDEVDANLEAMARAYQRLVNTNHHPTLDDLIDVCPQQTRQYYSTPKWRRILLKGLHRRGVTVNSNTTTKQMPAH